ncbi:GNAT family N-acetyltransferase [Abyssibius alkaniclasticus]|uniref:GNAT family N-acetyltransferase n=1 Tax=Abyssibius alkaniclasticus TaxID=2881234 RepID=UPI0023648B96|nr:GNAT family N-acetyltransferase [Abyssibius alkaniclasticus]UPH70025.1 GNAT family N-acetyltransferase [Abyssibius alkaniclasticus]
MSIAIRPLKEVDHASWRALWADYLAFYETRLPKAVYAQTFARMMADDPREFRGLVAEKGGELVGLAHYLLHRNAWSLADSCYLQDLFVRPAQRGSGIGGKLIAAVKTAAQAAGADALYWMTHESNTTARALYDRLAKRSGFIEYTVDMGAGNAT